MGNSKDYDEMTVQTLKKKIRQWRDVIENDDSVSTAQRIASNEIKTIEKIIQRKSAK